MKTSEISAFLIGASLLSTTWSRGCSLGSINLGLWSRLTSDQLISRSLLSSLVCLTLKITKKMIAMMLHQVQRTIGRQEKLLLKQPLLTITSCWINLFRKLKQDFKFWSTPRTTRSWSRSRPRSIVGSIYQKSSCCSRMTALKTWKL